MKKLLLVPAMAIILAGCSSIVEKTTADESQKIQPEPAKEVTTEVTAELGQTALYTDFTQKRYTELLGKKPFALFFHASWCPDCVYLENQIKKNISDLPQNAIILKANYDTESKLKQEYGITIQSTVVVIDKDGNAMPTLFGPSFRDLKNAIAQSL